MLSRATVTAVREPILANAERCSAPRAANENSVMASSGARLVLPGPSRTSPSGRVALRPAPSIVVTSASSAMSAVAPSAHGDALAMLPAMVAMLRICTDPT